jgi:hypothetical protein
MVVSEYQYYEFQAIDRQADATANKFPEKTARISEPSAGCIRLQYVRDDDAEQR